MRPILFVGITLVLLSRLTVVHSQANDVYVYFTAIVDWVDDPFCQHIRSYIHEGDSLRGFYVYDSTTLDVDPNPHRGYYEYSGPPYGFIVYSDELVFQSDPDNIGFAITIEDSVISGGLHDEYWAYSSNNLDVIGQSVDAIFIMLVDSSATAVSNDFLTPYPPDLDNWVDVHRFSVYGCGFSYHIRATLVSIYQVTGINNKHNNLITLLQNYPNPFNPTTTISFALPKKAHASLSIYNIEGKLVRMLVNDMLDQGYKEATWDGTDSQGNPVASGIYFYRLKAGKKTLTKKMVLLK